MPEPQIEWTEEVGRDHKGQSVLDFLDAAIGPVDRRAVIRAARAESILLNHKAVGPSATLRLGDVLELAVPPETLGRASASSQVELLHLSDDLVIGSKPSGLPFDESRRGGGSALGLLGDLAGERVGHVVRLRPGHRLDKETSGIVVASLGREAELALSTAFQDGTARVEYLALVRGSVEEDTGLVEVPLSKRRKADTRLLPDPDHGTPARTAWAVEERLRGFTWLRLTPEAGRSHQVRAHMAALGLPVVCDALYRDDDRLLLSQLKIDYRGKRGHPERPVLARPALHAARFVHGDLDLTVPVPDELEVALSQLRRLRPLR